jgi:anthranilate/para-aminobenzoate synthase component I
MYGGALGWLEPNGDAEFNVVIRSLQCYRGHARWDVGGGIVADSTMGEEWEETRAKAALLSR